MNTRLHAKEYFFKGNGLSFSLFEIVALKEVYIQSEVKIGEKKLANQKLEVTQQGEYFEVTLPEVYAQGGYFFKLISESGEIVFTEAKGTNQATLNLIDDSTIQVPVAKEAQTFIQKDNVTKQAHVIVTVSVDEHEVITTHRAYADNHAFALLVDNEAYYIKLKGFNQNGKLAVAMSDVIAALPTEINKAQLFLLETVLEQQVAVNLKMETAYQIIKNYVPVNDQLFVCNDKEGVLLVQDEKFISTMNRIVSKENVYAKNEGEYVPLERFIVADLDEGTEVKLYEQTVSDNNAYHYQPIKVNATTEKAYNELAIESDNGFLTITEGQLVLSVKEKKLPITLISHDFTQITVTSPLLTEVFLKPVKQSLAPIYLEKSDTGFTLDLLKTSLLPKNNYKLTGRTTETGQDLALHVTKTQPINLLGATLVTYDDKSIVTTHRYEDLIGKLFNVQMEGTKQIQHVSVDEMLVSFECLDLNPEEEHLMVKKRKANEARYLPITSLGDDRYQVDLGTLVLPPTEVIDKEFWDFYFESVDNSTIHRFLLEVNAEELSNPAKEKVAGPSREGMAQGIYLNKDNGFSLLRAPQQTYSEFMKAKEKTNLAVDTMTFDGRQFGLQRTGLEITKATLRLSIRKTDKVYAIEGTPVANGVSFDLTPFIEEQPERGLRLDFKISYETPTTYAEEVKIELTGRSKAKEGITSCSINEEDELMFYKTDTQLICATVKNHRGAVREFYQIKTQLTQLEKVNDHQYRLAFILTSSKDFELKDVQLKLRNNEYDVNLPCDITSHKDNKIQCLLTMDWDNYFPLYWDLFAGVTFEEQYEEIRISGSSKEVIKMVSSKEYLENSLVDASQERIIYPYLSFSNDISFMIRPKESYENKQTILKDKLGYLTYRLFQPYFDKKNIWLSFEKFASTAQDNGYAFFDYVQNNQLNPNHYYVLSKDSKDFAHVNKKHKNILKHMSYKYFVHLYASKLLIASETPRHVHNIRLRSGRAAQAIQNKKSVFLQHGVTALKQSSVFQKSPGRGNFDLVIATSEKEKTIIHENWLYDRDEIAVTGFSRWDLLKDRSHEQQTKTIFVMPTWRSWMEDMPEEEFIQTDYYQHYTAFINSERMQKLLDIHNLQLVFFLHPKFKEYISTFKATNERVQLFGFGDIKVNEMLMDSSLMISDYSSVTWDMLYMGKPIVFFQFDLEKYEQYEGSYIDMNTELFGEQVKTVETLIDTVEAHIQNNFALAPDYQAIREDSIKYLDQDNSKRIYETIKKGRLG